jgi:hypothetical protein
LKESHLCLPFKKLNEQKIMAKAALSQEVEESGNSSRNISTSFWEDWLQGPASKPLFRSSDEHIIWERALYFGIMGEKAKG